MQQREAPIDGTHAQERAPEQTVRPTRWNDRSLFIFGNWRQGKGRCDVTRREEQDDAEREQYRRDAQQARHKHGHALHFHPQEVGPSATEKEDLTIVDDQLTMAGNP